MGRNDILQVPGIAEILKELIAQKKSLVPFLGSGFSVPACPTWSDFLDLIFKSIKDKVLRPEEKNYYLQLKNSSPENKFEKMADFLVEKSGRRKFEEKMRAHFDKPLLPRMMPKFHLLHQVFPGLKITTNFDCLVENNTPDPHVRICYGDLPGELEQLFTHIEQNSLLKIHGGLRDIHSIVLSSSQYAAIYGDPEGFDPKAPLPLFLKRVLTNCSLLFIGCSLAHDRTIMIMESLRDMQLHFAIMRRPEEKHEQEKLNRRLSNLGIIPIWIVDFGQIEEILQRLIKPTGGHSEPPLIEHNVPFVGRVKELEQIRENIETAFHKKKEKIREELDERAGLAISYGSQAMILYDSGKLPEAMNLYKKAEEIFEELGDRAGLARSYADQAMILKAWKKFQEAMSLNKKAEEIFKELGDRVQLARIYGSQAVILYDWGKLPDAMVLHKKEEKMCEELSDRAGLARSYGNQGLILKARGKLPEAMALHKKEEKICEELDDHAGLARSYGNQGLILKAQGKLDDAMTLHKKQEKKYDELSDRAGLARSYGNQAMILKALGRFQEAMNLYKKVEKIFEKLGHRVQLTLKYSNQAIILSDWGKLQKATALHKKQEKNSEELGDRA
jgi:tetratricopeptide (TPR) repeat protein